jgi:sensor histidine kinase YesM
METIISINSAINNFVWGIPAMVCILGIGLYLSHEVLQNHGGDIIVESEKDQHTSFTITIPTIQN